MVVAGDVVASGTVEATALVRKGWVAAMDLEMAVRMAPKGRIGDPKETGDAAAAKEVLVNSDQSHIEWMPFRSFKSSQQSSKHVDAVWQSNAGCLVVTTFGC